MAQLYIFAAIVVCSVLLVPCSGSKSYEQDSSESISSSSSSESSSKENFQRTTDDENNGGECRDENTAPTCGVNEEYNACPDNVCEPKSCSEVGYQLNCTQTGSDSCPGKPGCVCVSGYTRDSSGKCIPSGNCPSCGGDRNAVLGCGSNCNKHCSDIGKEQRFCALVCRANACECKQGFYYDNPTKKCVRPKDCTITCGMNEVLNNCPSNCRRDYCPKNEADSKATCTTPKSCPKPACKCQFNYRLAANGTCIPTRECPKFPCHGRNEIYNPCPPFCPSDNCSQATPTGRCPLPGRIGITQECNPTCRCKPGFWRRNGICVPYGQCPNVCPANEVYSECIEKACKALNCTQKGQDVSCSDNRDGTCTKGCICKNNFLRDSNGTCIPEDECQTTELQCEDGEVVVDCPSDCPSDYCPQTDEQAQVTSCPQRNPCPKPACKCGFNSRKAANGSCIAASECPPIDCSDKPNQEFVACPPSCSDSCSQATPSGDCPKTIGHIGIVVSCQPKCRCIKHYFRNSNGTCVPYGECPGVCGKNEVYSDCRNTCPPQICKSILARYSCPRQPPPDCTAGCVCQPGFYKNNINDTDCIPACECPELANTSDCTNKTSDTTT